MSAREPPGRASTEPTTREAVKAEASRLGFLACGISGLEPTPHGDVLDRWLAAGHAGTMRYIHRQARKRKQPSQIDNQAITAVVVLDNYYHTNRSEVSQPKIARYAAGQDYHRAVAERLTKLAEFLRQNGAKVARAYVDAGPVPERELAQRAGLGWIGKNTMLIRPETGSFFFIASILTDLPLRRDEPFQSDRCGSCTRCLDACPTAAFVEPRVLDATRCISYVTIEQRGNIAPDIAEQLEGWAFGCDICNEVCPWNQRFATETSHSEFHPRTTFSGAKRDFFDQMTPEEFAQRFSDTPLERTGLERMRRNWKAGWESLGPTGES